MTKLSFSVRISENVFESFQPDQLSDEHSEIYELIGRIIALWNRVEFNLTYLTTWLHPLFRSQLPSDHKRPPRGLEAKIGFLKYLMREYNEFSIFQDEFFQLVEHINSVKNERHKLVHWSLHRFEATPAGLKLLLTNPEKLAVPLETYEIDKISLYDLAKKLGIAGLGMSFFASSFRPRLFDEFEKRKS